MTKRAWAMTVRAANDAFLVPVSSVSCTITPSSGPNTILAFWASAVAVASAPRASADPTSWGFIRGGTAAGFPTGCGCRYGDLIPAKSGSVYAESPWPGTAWMDNAFANPSYR